MTNEPTAMKEIHDIRLKIHEETKDMSPEQRANHANAQAQKLMDQYGLKLHMPVEAANRKIV